MRMKRVFVAGHLGMVGSAICCLLKQDDKIDLIVKPRNELDLTEQSQVRVFFQENRIDEVYLAAAKVGGIQANSDFPVDFLYENLAIQTNVIQAAHCGGVKKLLFLGSSCIYPKSTHQPISEESLLSGPLEPTNEPYALAKIVGLKLCEAYRNQFGRDYRTVMPTNLYGPGDSFHHVNSHVIPALIRRFHEATINNSDFVVVWGSGKPMREFLHVDDMAAASVFVMNLDQRDYVSAVSRSVSHVNIGQGTDISIFDLAYLVSDVVGFRGQIVWDSSKPDGTFRKLLNVSRLEKLGWRSSIQLEDGLRSTYEWFLSNSSRLRL
jgi:GDP-L-fucose synthase